MRALIIIAVLALSLMVLYAVPGVKPVSTLMIADWLHGREVQRNWVPIERISRPMIHSVIAAEDARYCGHGGVDWPALEQATERALAGKPTNGASTIAMQTAKNLFLWPERLYVRKAAEVPLALLMDALWGKTRLMEIYLNMIELGDGIYGVEAASQYYFGQPAARVSYDQSARLAATLPNPRRNPTRLSPEIAAIARTIEARALSNAVHSHCIRP